MLLFWLVSLFSQFVYAQYWRSGEESEVGATLGA
jgi:hypothetical protein